MRWEPTRIIIPDELLDKCEAAMEQEGATDFDAWAREVLLIYAEDGIVDGTCLRGEEEAA